MMSLNSHRCLEMVAFLNLIFNKRVEGVCR
jgi:hypothetical protein